jgi:hypothetical protein
MKTINEKANIVEENVYTCLALLDTYIKENNLKGTSVTTALGQTTIDGKLWQIQIRLESEDIISTTEVFETIKVNI